MAEEAADARHLAPSISVLVTKKVMEYDPATAHIFHRLDLACSDIVRFTDEFSLLIKSIENSIKNHAFDPFVRTLKTLGNHFLLTLLVISKCPAL